MSVVVMTGLLGILGWKVTVISSNFITYVDFNNGNEYSYEHQISSAEKKNQNLKK